MRPFVNAGLCILLLTCSQVGTSHACTSFCLDTTDGPVFAANLDLFIGEGLVFLNRRGISKEGYLASTTGETARWVSEYGSVTFNLVGRELPWGGMNEAGLAVSTMMLLTTVHQEPDGRPPLVSGTLVQYVLDTCGSVSDVIDVISQVRLAEDACHFMVADALGDCAVIEYLDGNLVCYSGETLPVEALANAPYAAGITFIEHGLVPAFNPGESVERVAAAAEKIEMYATDHGDSPVDYSLRVLTESVVAPRRWWSDLFHEPYTRWSVVYDIGRREAHFRTVACPTVKSISLEGLDLSCESPLKMLDVNVKLAGNVNDSFALYDHDVNLKVFREFCDKWGIDVSEDGAQELMRLFESFECAP